MSLVDDFLGDTNKSWSLPPSLYSYIKRIKICTNFSIRCAGGDAGLRVCCEMQRCWNRRWGPKIGHRHTASVRLSVTLSIFTLCSQNVN